MIFATVGTPQQPFNRLVKAVDDFAAQTDEMVIVQIGTATFEPLYAEYFRWATSLEMEKYTQDSRVVITQASAGATILALKYRKPLIVVPRLSKYGEHFNDHQNQLAFALQQSGQAILVENLTETGLKDAVECAVNRKVIHNNQRELVVGLKNLLNGWQSQVEQKKSGRKH